MSSALVVLGIFFVSVGEPSSENLIRFNGEAYSKIYFEIFYEIQIYSVIYCEIYYEIN